VNTYVVVQPNSPTAHTISPRSYFCHVSRQPLGDAVHSRRTSVPPRGELRATAFIPAAHRSHQSDLCRLALDTPGAVAALIAVCEALTSTASRPSTLSLLATYGAHTRGTHTHGTHTHGTHCHVGALRRADCDVAHTQHGCGQCGTSCAAPCSQCSESNRRKCRKCRKCRKPCNLHMQLLVAGLWLMTTVSPSTASNSTAT